MAINQNNPTSYGFSQPLIGVPSAPIIAKKDPTVNDRAQLGTLWINQLTQSVYILTVIEDAQSNWELLSTSSGTVTNLTSDDGMVATPLGGVIGILSGANIITSSGTHSIFIAVTDSVSLAGSLAVAGNISLPNTSNISVGVIEFGGLPFITNKGTSNTFVGQNAGNVTLTGTNNSGFGYHSLIDLTTGSSNAALGSDALDGLTTGDHDIAIGAGAGSSYTTESNNIVIGNTGTGSDSNTLRIGTQGSGSGQINTAYIAGIYNNSVGSTAGVVSIDSTGKLGSSNGTNGQILIGGSTKPIWANLTSMGGSVTITNGVNSINLEASGVAALTGLDGDTGSATPLAGVITIAGDGVAIKTAASSHTVEVEITGGTNGQLLIGATAGSPIWANLASSGGSVVITNSANGINLEAAGIPPGLVTLTSQSGTATPVASNIDIVGTTVINTTASGDTLNVNLTNGTDGQVLIGGGSNPTWANITAGSGITIVNSANGIEISATGMGPVAIFEYNLAVPRNLSAINYPNGFPPQPFCANIGTMGSIPAPNSGAVWAQVFDTGPYVNYSSSGAFTITAIATGYYLFVLNFYINSFGSNIGSLFFSPRTTTANAFVTGASNVYSAFPLFNTGANVPVYSPFYMATGDTVFFNYYGVGVMGTTWSLILGSPQTSILGYFLG